MKKIMIMGGFVGFGIGVITGLVKEGMWPALFFGLCGAVLFSNLMFLGWGQAWRSGLNERLASLTSTPTK
jgi:hypothetical protein